MSEPGDDASADDDGHQLTFEDTVTLGTTKERLWSVISDPEVLARCVPGAEDVTRESERRYTCRITRGISHLTLSLTGEVEFVELNEPDWVVANGSAYDPKTHSDFDVLAAMELADADDGSATLTYSAQVSYTGGIASLPERLLRPIVSSDVDTFFENLRATVDGEGGT